MTASEFSFLALGLVLGLVSGAALIEFVRARPPTPREVKVTVSPDSVPRRRPATLTDDAFSGSMYEPARGGPADRRMATDARPAGAVERRTSVQSGMPLRAETAARAIEVTGAVVGTSDVAAPDRVPAGRAPGDGGQGLIVESSLPPAVPIVRAAPETAGAAGAGGTDGSMTAPAADRAGSATPRADDAADPRVGILIATGEDPAMRALRRGVPVVTAITVAQAGPASSDPVPRSPAMPARPAPVASSAMPARPAPVASSATSRPNQSVPVASSAAAAQDRPAAVAASAAASRPSIIRAVERPRTAGGEAFVAATSNPEPSPVAAEPCGEERRIAAERCEVATRARAAADAEVDALQIARRSYDSHEAAAAAAMLIADPRAIGAAKEEAHGGFRAAVAAAATPEAQDAAARDWLIEINRINGQAREATSSVTRERAAAREIGLRLERLALEADAARISAENADAACLAARSAVADCDELAAGDRSGLLAPVAGAPGRIHLDEDETLGIALEAGGEPLIFRLLRGDRAAMSTLVTSLAGDDLDQRRHWQLLVTRLLDAIIADAIEGSALEFPDDHPFWGMFSRAERRDVAHGLASIGYRFDGLGGWADGRYPSQRDLSLALGYAGLDPMRVRLWPNEEATKALFAETTVAADVFLAAAAGDLTLAEMVAMLGRRADGLAEAWNAWGRIRPLLLAEG